MEGVLFRHKKRLMVWDKRDADDIAGGRCISRSEHKNELVRNL